MTDLQARAEATADAVIRLPRPDLPAHHPQNVPLNKWTDGWLKMSCASETGPSTLYLHDKEKRALGLPVTRQEMIEFLIGKGEVPAAGVGEVDP